MAHVGVSSGPLPLAVASVTVWLGMPFLRVEFRDSWRWPVAGRAERMLLWGCRACGRPTAQ